MTPIQTQIGVSSVGDAYLINIPSNFDPPKVLRREWRRQLKLDQLGGWGVGIDLKGEIHRI